MRITDNNKSKYEPSMYKMMSKRMIEICEFHIIPLKIKALIV